MISISYLHKIKTVSASTSFREVLISYLEELSCLSPKGPHSEFLADIKVNVISEQFRLILSDFIFSHFWCKIQV